MAEEPPGIVALLAIHPSFAKAIVDGAKTVEFRRRSFALPVSHVLVYATAPVQAVVGFFCVSAIVEGAPEDLWNEFGQQGRIERSAYERYFTGRTRGVAIGVRDAVPFEQPLRLAALCGDLSVPQSYRYLSWGLFDRALAIATRTRYRAAAS